jgi:hypothetical protein
MKQSFTREYFQRKGSIGGRKPRDRAAAARLGWIKRKANAVNKENYNVTNGVK